MDAIWQLILDWLSGRVVWSPTPEHLAQALAYLATFTAGVQALKKVLENAAKWEWLLKLIPQLAKVFEWFAHGVGPQVLNLLLTGGAALAAALNDGKLSLGEIIAVLGGMVGVDLIYRLIRGWLFPKKA